MMKTVAKDKELDLFVEALNQLKFGEYYQGTAKSKKVQAARKKNKAARKARKAKKR